MSQQIKFGGYDCTIEFSRYHVNGRTCINLIDAKDGEQVTTATVNLPDADLRDGEVLIKTWSENDGLLEVLEAANIVKRTGRTVPTGFVEAQICKLLQ